MIIFIVFHIKNIFGFATSPYHTKQSSGNFRYLINAMHAKHLAIYQQITSNKQTEKKNENEFKYFVVDQDFQLKIVSPAFKIMTTCYVYIARRPASLHNE